MLSNKLTIDRVDFQGKRVLIRVDFNVPMKNGKVGDTGRIVAALPSINYILRRGARSVVILTHMGRPKGRKIAKFSLAPVAPVLEKLLGRQVTFMTDCAGPAVERACANPPEGSVILLENCRFYLGEEGKGLNAEGKKVKATKQQIAELRASFTRLGDIYVNDAFGTAHRAHSSMVGVKLPQRVSGFLMQKELVAFNALMHQPKRPFVAVLGGAKVQDKIALISNLLDKVDEMIIGGAMAYTFLKVLQGVEIGKSLFDKAGAELVHQIMDKADAKGVKVHLPVDHRCGDKIGPDAKVVLASNESGIPADFMGLDIGPKTIANFVDVIWKSKSVFVNGPHGVFEQPAFALGTQASLQACAAITKLKNAVTIIGGGDSAAACRELGFDRFVTHVSTGGGAALELLEGKTLPGIAALSLTSSL